MTSTTTNSFVSNTEDSKTEYSDEIGSLNDVTPSELGGVSSTGPVDSRPTPSGSTSAVRTDTSSPGTKYKDDILQFENSSSIPSELLSPTGEFTQTEDTSQTARKWAEVRAYGFSIAGFNLLAPIGVYCEVITQFHLAPLPNAPEHCVGLIPLRGNLVPVYQLHSLFGRPTIDARYALVIGSASRCAALVVEDKPIPMDFETLLPLSFAKESLPDIMQENISRCFQNSNDSDHPWYVLEHLSLFRTLAQLT